MPQLTIARGMCFPLFAYDVARAIDLDAAEQRVRAGTERQTIKHKRRAPAYFEYQPAPLRVTQDGEEFELAGYRAAAGVEVVLYDFGAVSVSYAIPIAGPLDRLPALSSELWGNERLVADSRRQVEQLVATLGTAVIQPNIADLVEDYSIFQIAELSGSHEGDDLWSPHAHTIAQILRADTRRLSRQEVDDATASRLSFGPDDATFIDSDVSLIFDSEGDDVRDVIEFANTQLLEMRYLDQQLDAALERSYETLSRRPPRLPLAGQHGADLRRLSRLQLDGAILFEQVSNALKLVGEQYLARAYSLTSRRFHLAEWDASITRKLQVIDGIYGKLADRAATRRMELLEWIIIALITLSLLLSFGVAIKPH